MMEQLPEIVEVTEKAKMTVRICARCHRPIPRGEEMVEKIDGWYVTTHLECHRGAEYTPRKKDLDTMIRDALRGGPGDQLRRKEMGR